MPVLLTVDASPVNKVFKTDIPLFSISIWRNQIIFFLNYLAGSKSFQERQAASLYKPLLAIHFCKTVILGWCANFYMGLIIQEDSLIKISNRQHVFFIFFVDWLANDETILLYQSCFIWTGHLWSFMFSKQTMDLH